MKMGKNRTYINLNEQKIKNMVSRVLKESLYEIGQENISNGPCVLKFFDSMYDTMYYKIFQSRKDAEEKIDWFKGQAACYRNPDCNFQIIDLTEEEMNALKIVKNLQEKKKVYIDGILRRWK